MANRKPLTLGAIEACHVLSITFLRRLDCRVSRPRWVMERAKWSAGGHGGRFQTRVLGVSWRVDLRVVRGGVVLGAA